MTAPRFPIHTLLSAPLVLLMAATPALAQDAGTPSVEVLEGLYPGTAYSPYADRNFPNNVYWGDTHVHTSLSLDAGLFGNTLGHDEAYRLARGAAGLLEQRVQMRVVERPSEYRHRRQPERMRDALDLPEAEVARDENGALSAGQRQRPPSL